MINLLESLRAKSEGDNLLLKDHIIETVKRAYQLEKFVKLNKNSIDFNWIKDKEFFDSLKKAMFLHDLGKIAYEFQKKLFKGEENPELLNYLMDLKGIDVDHEILSAIWASLLLSNSPWDKMIKTAILFHHYNSFFTDEMQIDMLSIIDNYFEDIVRYLTFLSKNSSDFKQLLNNIISESKKQGFIIPIDKKQIDNFDLKLKELLTFLKEKEEDKLYKFSEFYDPNENPDIKFFVFLGSLRRCDYSASGDLVLESTKKSIDEIYKNLESKIKENIGKASIWQEGVLKELDNDKFVVLVAPTGSGKTEFALMWSKRRGGKLLYTLPLRVAINDLFVRFKEKYFNKNEVDILHSTSFIEYVEGKEGKEVDIEKKLNAAKLLSSPILITTPDQIFLTSLWYYGADKIISVYPVSSVIIDEIQTYNEEMASIIINTINLIKELKGNILVMTATLPPYFEPFLEDFKKIDTKEKKTEIKNYNLKRHRLKIEDNLFIDMDSKGKIDEGVHKYINDAKNVLIVVNTVRKAIAVYKNLRDRENVYLLHSRLLQIEKERRIREIKEKLKNNERVIVVSTQIIEASVDFDFDLMITEISTIDSQIQRWGRVYRNRGNIDYNLPKPNVVIYNKRDKGTDKIYDSKVVDKTKEILEKHNNELLNYEMERKMIEEVFNSEIKSKKLKDIYIEKIKENQEFLKFFNVSKKSEAQRLFREIAGFSVVFPQIMEEDGKYLQNKEGEVYKIFSQIIKSGKDRPWKEIIDEIRDKTGVNTNKWSLKKLLYQYSISVPSHMLRAYISGNFKGFYIYDRLDNKKIKDIKEFGLEELHPEQIGNYI